MDVSHGFHIFRDGNMWCAVGPHFRNIQEDRAGFGETQALAYRAWWRDNEKDLFWRDKTKPEFEQFTVHQ